MSEIMFFKQMGCVMLFDRKKEKLKKLNYDIMKVKKAYIFTVHPRRPQ